MAGLLQVHNVVVNSVKRFKNRNIDLPDDFSSLTTMFLCVKYNPEALGKMLELAGDHGLLDEVMAETDGRNYNLLQFATLNKEPVCLQ